MLTRYNIVSFYSQFTNEANILNEYAEMDVLQLRECAKNMVTNKRQYRKRLINSSEHYNRTGSYYEDENVYKAIKREIRHLNTLIVRKMNALGEE